MLAEVRDFFAQRGVLEVETPCLASATGTDLHLTALSTQLEVPGEAEAATWYWQTSPEFAMKRLLAAGSGCIFQICKAFRDGESGRYHNLEFTLLEWYRLDFDSFDLMDELGLLLKQLLLLADDYERVCDLQSYHQVWQFYLGMDPHTATWVEFQHCAIEKHLPDAAVLCGYEHTLWLDYLFSTLIQPHLGQDNKITFIYDYPASQASLARIRPGRSPVAERFEVFVEGIELANGFHELSDVTEQQQRFQAEQQQRSAKGLNVPALDQRLLAALDAGLPDCSGVALGLDRVLMLISGLNCIDDVLTFPVTRA